MEELALKLDGERLRLPEYHLYRLALEAEKMEDVAETRRAFKKALVSRKMEEGIECPAFGSEAQARREPAQRERLDFLRSADAETRVRRSRELILLCLRHQNAGRTAAEAERLAMAELLEGEFPLAVTKMDLAYFTNPEIARADLEGFLKQCKGKTIAELSTGNPERNKQIQAQNGEPRVAWETYLSRASGKLLGTKDGSKNPHRRAEALDELKKIVGIEIKKYPTMDKAYFSDPKNVRADLEEFL